MANEDKAVKFNMDNLDDLIKSLKSNYVLRVGILGSKASAQHDGESSKTNAEIGTFHEFGTKKLPRRSFLEDSLKLKLKFNDSQFADMRKKLFKEMFIKKKPVEFLQDLGVKCLEIIEEGFETNGFGMWQPLSDNLREQRDTDVLNAINKLNNSINRLNSNLKSFNDLDRLENMKKRMRTLKNNFIEYGSKILTDTGKLRHSITFKVIKKK